MLLCVEGNLRPAEGGGVQLRSHKKTEVLAEGCSGGGDAIAFRRDECRRLRRDSGRDGGDDVQFVGDEGAGLRYADDGDRWAVGCK